MTEVEAAVAAAKETTVFLSYFEDLPDYRQKGKVAYPLDKVLLLCWRRRWRGRRPWPTCPALGRPSWGCCGGFAASLTAGLRIISWASFSPNSPNRVSALLRRLDGGGDEHIGGGDRHRRQDGAALLPEERRRRAYSCRLAWTKKPSPATSPHDPFSRFPWVPAEARVD